VSLVAQGWDGLRLFEPKARRGQAHVPTFSFMVVKRSFMATDVTHAERKSFATPGGPKDSFGGCPRQKGTKLHKVFDFLGENFVPTAS